jgi:hypothetical protein
MKPTEQFWQLAEPATADVLTAHCKHVATDDAPTRLLAVPA